MANRYADDIRRIVGIDDVGNPLGPLKERQRIPGGRGIAYNTASGIGSSSGFSNSGTGVPSGSSSFNPSGDDTTDLWGDDGLGGHSLGAGSAGRENPYDVTDPYTLISQLTATDVNEAMTDYSHLSADSLRIISGKDPSTGNNIEVYLGPLDFPPPSGWQDPNIPPTSGPDPTWQQGYYWETGSANAPDKYASPREAADAVVSGINDNIDGNVYEETGLNQISESEYEVCLQQVVSEGDPLPTPGPEFCITIFRSACGIGDPDGPGDYCSLVPPDVDSPEYWPALDKIILKMDEGLGVLNPYQNPSDLEGFTQANSSKINIESSESPGTYYSIETSGNGGTLVYETNGPGGEPQGVYKVFDSTGQFTGYGDVSSIDYVRPDSK